MAPSPRRPLRACLDDIFATSNRLVVDLCEPAGRLGLGREEHLILLMLWDTDGMPEATLVERLSVPTPLVQQALDAIEDKALIERGRHEKMTDVWLTQAGRALRDQAGKGEMCRRLRLFERDIADLHAKLQHALDRVGEEVAGFGPDEGQA
jgi:DNA-binding MarR family transcriptional regulator